MSDIAIIPFGVLARAMGGRTNAAWRVLAREGWTYWADRDAYVRPGAPHASVVHQLRQLRRRGLVA